MTGNGAARQKAKRDEQKPERESVIAALLLSRCRDAGDGLKDLAESLFNLSNIRPEAVVSVGRDEIADFCKSRGIGINMHIGATSFYDGEFIWSLDRKAIMKCSAALAHEYARKPEAAKALLGAMGIDGRELFAKLSLDLIEEHKAMSQVLSKLLIELLMEGRTLEDRVEEARGKSAPAKRAGKELGEEFAIVAAAVGRCSGTGATMAQMLDAMDGLRQVGSVKVPERTDPPRLQSSVLRVYMGESAYRSDALWQLTDRGRLKCDVALAEAYGAHPRAAKAAMELLGIDGLAEFAFLSVELLGEHANLREKILARPVWDLLGEDARLRESLDASRRELIKPVRRKDGGSLLLPIRAG
jgi:hypothetical protein